jgi:hypothetical protein
MGSSFCSTVTLRRERRKEAIQSFEFENSSSEEDPHEYANIEWSPKKTRKSMHIFSGAQQKSWRSKSSTAMRNKAEKKGFVGERNTERAFMEAMERELGTVARNFPFFLLRGQESSFRTKTGKIARATQRRSSEDRLLCGTRGATFLFSGEISPKSEVEN